MIYGILILLLIIIPIAIAYYYDYKQDPEEFNFSIKTLGKGIYKGFLYAVIFVGLNSLYEFVIPLNKKHGTEFNYERKKMGIPVLNKNWVEFDNEQYSITWWNPEILNNGYFKKIVEYGILDAKLEIDYYRNSNFKGTFVWSKYDYRNSTFEYFIEKLNNKTVSVSESGKLKMEKPTIIEKIDKLEFEKYITK